MENIISMVDTMQPIISEHDHWQFIASMEESESVWPKSMLIVPFNEWLETSKTVDLDTPKAFWLDNDTDVHQLAPWLEELELIALQFPKFVDGRAYSQAVELRTRLHWKGEIRAVGDVLRDQLSHMYRCGFNSFAVREDKNIVDAAKGLMSNSSIYSASVVEPQPLFRRRTTNIQAKQGK